MYSIMGTRELTVRKNETSSCSELPSVSPILKVDYSGVD